MRLLIFSCRKRLPTLLKVIRDAQIPYDILCDFDEFYSGNKSSKGYSGVIIEGDVFESARQGDLDIIEALGNIFPTFIKRPEAARQPLGFSYYSGFDSFGDFLLASQSFPVRPYRSTDRIPLKLKTFISRDAKSENVLEVRTLNISETGCALDLDLSQVEAYPPGTELLLRFESLGEQNSIPATVCWFSDLTKDFVGVGLQFSELPKPVSEQIKRMILRHLISPPSEN